MNYDVIIVGAGPAGLLAGCVLQENGFDFKIIEKGKKYINRNRNNPFDVSYGFGGAGLFSDGKLSYSPSASNLWTKLNNQKLLESYEYIKSFFESLNIEIRDWDPSWTSPFDYNTVKYYESKNLTQHDRNTILDNIYNRLHDHLIFNESVSHIKNINSKYNIICKSKRQYESKTLIMATGKYSSIKLFSEDMQMKLKFCSEMGVRLEVKNEFFNPAKEDQLDYKIIEKIDDSTERRTFCCCKDGEIRKSFYESYITYNGELVEKSSGFSNIGVVLRTYNPNSTYAKEMDNSLIKAESRVIDIDEFGNGNIIIGRETDILLKELVDRLIKEKSNGKIYGPEIEKYGYYPQLDVDLCNKNNLYFIGDSTGIFRGLMAAFISGVYVGLIISEISKQHIIQNHMNQLNIKQSNTEEMKLIFTAQSKAFFYCRDVVCQYVLEQGFLPINPFRVFDYFLSDRVDRELIRRGNNQLIRKCDELWVFGQIADGVLFEIASAIEQGKKVRFFSVGTNVKNIQEIGLDQISFEPEVHARQVKKTDLINFIKNAHIDNADEKDDSVEQLTIFDFLK